MAISLWALSAPVLVLCLPWKPHCQTGIRFYWYPRWASISCTSYFELKFSDCVNANIALSHTMYHFPTIISCFCGCGITRLWGRCFQRWYVARTSASFIWCSVVKGMIMDWREMAGRPTVIEVPIGERLWAWRGGKKVGYGWTEDLWDGTMDHRRGWIIAFCWIVACSAE